MNFIPFEILKEIFIYFDIFLTDTRNLKKIAKSTYAKM